MQVNKTKRLVRWLFILTAAMFGFGFLLVPLYKTMCTTFGINGKPNATAQAYDSQHAIIDTSREVTVEFLTTLPSTLDYEFYPRVRKIVLHPGELKRVTFYAKNRSKNDMVVQAIPSITPGIAAKYLIKTECFCFTQQKFAAHFGMDMPVLFHLDPELPKDVKTVTLSYTMFDVTDRVRQGPEREEEKRNG
jgi:cytochrome c oxidase assembly protein subunit 11